MAVRLVANAQRLHNAPFQGTGRGTRCGRVGVIVAVSGILALRKHKAACRTPPGTAKRREQTGKINIGRGSWAHVLLEELQVSWVVLNCTVCSGNPPPLRGADSP